MAEAEPKIYNTFGHVIRFGLVGRTLGYSFSRGYFEQKFKELRLDEYSYLNLEVATKEDLRAAIHNAELQGFNVTIPYKCDIIDLLSHLSPDAEAIGAVNVVSRVGEEWHGHNTDWQGFQLSLKQAGFQPSPGDQALILGTGGAAAAVAYALGNLGMKVKLVSRTPTEDQLSYAELPERSPASFSMVVNTTPLGTSPDTDRMPNFPVFLLDHRHWVVDLIYNPAETRFLREARLAGAQTLNGLPMLHGQAEAAWAIWKSTL